MNRISFLCEGCLLDDGLVEKGRGIGKKREERIASCKKLAHVGMTSDKEEKGDEERRKVRMRQGRR